MAEPKQEIKKTYFVKTEFCGLVPGTVCNPSEEHLEELTKNGFITDDEKVAQAAKKEYDAEQARIAKKKAAKSED